MLRTGRESDESRTSGFADADTSFSAEVAIQDYSGHFHSFKYHSRNILNLFTSSILILYNNILYSGDINAKFTFIIFNLFRVLYWAENVSQDYKLAAS